MDVISLVGSGVFFMGPLLTLVVLRVGTASLNFVMSAIIFIQLAALLWGITVTYSQRPVYAALVSDNYIISIVAASEIDGEKIKDPELKVSIWSRPRLAYVDLPYGDKEYSRIGNENLTTGRRFSQYAEFYRPISDFRQDIIEHSIDIHQRMAQYPQLKQAVTEIVKTQGGEIDDYLFISVDGRVSIGMLIIRRDSLTVVDALLD